VRAHDFNILSKNFLLPGHFTAASKKVFFSVCLRLSFRLARREKKLRKEREEVERGKVEEERG